MNRLVRIVWMGVPLLLAVGSLTPQTPAPSTSKPAAAKAESCSQTAKTQME